LSRGVWGSGAAAGKGGDAEEFGVDFGVMAAAYNEDVLAGDWVVTSVVYVYLIKSMS
jgi:hypothetical protein